MCKSGVFTSGNIILNITYYWLCIFDDCGYLLYCSRHCAAKSNSDIFLSFPFFSCICCTLILSIKLIYYFWFFSTLHDIAATILTIAILIADKLVCHKSLASSPSPPNFSVGSLMSALHFFCHLHFWSPYHDNIIIFFPQSVPAITSCNCFCFVITNSAAWIIICCHHDNCCCLWCYSCCHYLLLALLASPLPSLLCNHCCCQWG